MTRLDRLLAERGHGPRRDAQRLIRRGRVTVDGATVHDPGARVSEDAAIALDGVAVEPLPIMLAWHKPAGVVCTLDDPWGRATLAEVLPEAWRTAFHPVGRLDAETTGLLLFSRDGALTQRLLHPKRAVERAYRARVAPAPGPDLGERLAAGVATAEGTHTARLLRSEGDVVELVVTEGRHRMVRRMLANLGHPVVALTRLRFGPVTLGDLASGEYRPLGGDELEHLGIHRAFGGRDAGRDGDSDGDGDGNDEHQSDSSPSGAAPEQSGNSRAD